MNEISFGNGVPLNSEKVWRGAMSLRRLRTTSLKMNVLFEEIWWVSADFMKDICEDLS